MWTSQVEVPSNVDTAHIGRYLATLEGTSGTLQVCRCARPLKGGFSKKWNFCHWSSLIHWCCRYFSFLSTRFRQHFRPKNCASGDLYWRIRWSVLAHPPICTSASGDLYWSIHRSVLADTQGDPSYSLDVHTGVFRLWPELLPEVQAWLMTKVSFFTEPSL